MPVGKPYPTYSIYIYANMFNTGERSLCNFLDKLEKLHHPGVSVRSRVDSLVRSIGS